METAETTRLLRALAGGDPSALEQLTPRVYHELRRIAGYHMKNEQRGRTLQTTALVNEAYLQLIDVKNVDWDHRAHFLAVCATIMRRILLERARKRSTAKRGGQAARLNLEEVADLSSNRDKELVALDAALDALAKIEPRRAKVVELRFFGGLSVEETAQALKISQETVFRDWRVARAWLLAELGGAT